MNIGIGINEIEALLHYYNEVNEQCQNLFLERLEKLINL